jgi:hypothetical protein
MTKILTFCLVVSFFSVLLINFDSIFTDLNCDALSVSQSVKKDADEVPNSINFIDEDKALFLDYCEENFQDKLPMEVDNSNFIYYGTVSGYRIYRLQATNIDCENINQSEAVGGYTFESSQRFRPYKLGLYAIGDGNVYTLYNAYSKNLIDISKVYRLYAENCN